MKFSAVFFALATVMATSVASVAAAPAPEAANDIAARVSAPLIVSTSCSNTDSTSRQAPSSGTIYVCDTWDWQGSCANIGFNNGQCTNFPSNFQDNISSIGPDGGWTCQVFM